VLSQAGIPVSLTLPSRYVVCPVKWGTRRITAIGGTRRGRHELQGGGVAEIRATRALAGGGRSPAPAAGGLAVL